MPVEEYGQIQDIDTDGEKPVSDSDVKAFMLKRHAMANPLINHGVGSADHFLR